MLVSDKYQFIVACPTKTGTNTMRAIAEKWLKDGGDPAVLCLLKGEATVRHRLAPPPGKESYHRYMMVRHPERRWVSMYEYLRRKDWEYIADEIAKWEREHGRERSWVMFLEWIVNVRQEPEYADAERKAHGLRPYMWTDRQDELILYMKGELPSGERLSWYKRRGGRSRLRLEHIEQDWKALVRRHKAFNEGLGSVVIPRRNSTTDDDRMFLDDFEYLVVDGAVEAMERLGVSDECYALGYYPLEP